MKNIYYVYTYIDPITNIPFYVGYGHGKRYKDHLIEAKRNPIPEQGQHKLNKIRKLLKEGIVPEIQIIDKDISKNIACDLEIFLISEIGRIDLGTGPLTNLTSGGDGNREWSDDQRKKCSEQRKNFIAAKDPKTGKKIKVHKEDIKWTSGELVGQNLGEVNLTNKNGKLTGYIIAINPITGENFRVKRTDPRWVSGELVGINKGKPAHINTILAAKSKKGIPKSKEHNKKVSDAVKLLKWYYNAELEKVGRYIEGKEPAGYIRVTGPHRKIPI